MKYILLTETSNDDSSIKLETMYSIDIFFCKPNFTTRSTVQLLYMITERPLEHKIESLDRSGCARTEYSLEMRDGTPINQDLFKLTTNT